MGLGGKSGAVLISGMAGATLVIGLSGGTATAAPGHVEPAHASSASRRCGIGIVGPPGTWSKTHLLPCSIAGSPGHKVTYHYKRTWGSVCAVQVRGYKKGKKKWYNGGIDGKRTVPWGNVWAAPAVRIKCVPGAGHYSIGL
ncbi:hypothetical protein ACQEU3_38680 [Spirillospora sp. CA-253888]